MDELSAHDWVVYAKPPFGDAEHVLQCLARYKHRVAISNHQIVSIDESYVTFRWKDYANNNQQRTMTRVRISNIVPKSEYGTKRHSAVSWEFESRLLVRDADTAIDTISLRDEPENV